MLTPSWNKENGIEYASMTRPGHDYLVLIRNLAMLLDDLPMERVSRSCNSGGAVGVCGEGPVRQAGGS